MHQTARRELDDTLVVEAEFVFVFFKRDGTPTPVPEEIARFLGAKPSNTGRDRGGADDCLFRSS